ncbi:MAG: HEPN domain-containing protein [Anaerolineae bacterium]|nr:HEPN domain-containing protein [Anaerolineae bacterium]
MKPETAEWVAKAEGDWHTAQREIQATEYPNYDGVCFHAQQAVEKYLKAVIAFSGKIIPRTHNLEELQQAVLMLGQPRHFLNWT